MLQATCAIASPHGESSVHVAALEFLSRSSVEQPRAQKVSQEQSESKVLAISPLDVRFLDTKVQEKERAWSQVDLLMSKIPM